MTSGKLVNMSSSTQGSVGASRGKERLGRTLAASCTARHAAAAWRSPLVAAGIGRERGKGGGGGAWAAAAAMAADAELAGAVLQGEARCAEGTNVLRTPRRA